MSAFHDFRYWLRREGNRITKFVSIAAIGVGSAMFGAALESAFGKIEAVGNSSRGLLSDGQFLFILAAFGCGVLALTSAAVAAFFLLAKAARYDMSIERDYYTDKRTTGENQGSNSSPRDRADESSDDIESSKTAYKLCSSVALRAKRSIFVVGPHFVPNSPDHSDTSHSDYLTNGIEKAVRRHAENHESDFEYTRFVQFDEETAGELVESGDLPISHINNDALGEHIEKMLEVNHQSHNIRIKIYGRKYIPSFPSMLIVDDEWIFFSLPSYIRPTKAGNKSFDYDFVFAVQDKTKEIPKSFRQMISQFELEAWEIKRLARLHPQPSAGPQESRNFPDEEAQNSPLNEHRAVGVS